MEFGTQEDLHKIQDIELKGPNGETLYLAYKISRHSFMLPYTMSDDGYVLGVVGEPRRYFRLDAAQTEKLQAQKLLPNPLPAYTISWLDYVMGHFLWFVLAGIGVSVLCTSLMQQRRKGAAPFAQAGITHHRAGNLDAAISAYSKALKRNPKLVDVLMLRGDAYKSRGEIGRAIADFTRAIKRNQGPTAYFMRGNAYLAGGEVQAAIKDYTSAIDRNNEFAAAHQSRAIAYERTGRSDLAQADRQAAARISGAARGEAA